MRQNNKNWAVYAHKNKINKKIYIGITGQKPERRWRNGQGHKTSTYFYNAIQKYGWNNFEHIILQFNLTQQEAEQKEKYYIQKYNTLNDIYGYNIKKGGKLNQGLSKQGRKKFLSHQKRIGKVQNLNKSKVRKLKNNGRIQNLNKNKVRKLKNNGKIYHLKKNNIIKKQVKKYNVLKLEIFFLVNLVLQHGAD